MRRSVSLTVSAIDWANIRMRPSISSARVVKLVARASMAPRRSSSDSSALELVASRARDAWDMLTTSISSLPRTLANSSTIAPMVCWSAPTWRLTIWPASSVWPMASRMVPA
ncbi:hypothetical protein D3C87_1550550 [compost metagenome]